MNFNLTDERQMLQDSLRRYLQDSYTDAIRKAVAEGKRGFSADVWNGLAELGVVGALFDEEHGGFGGAGFDLAVVFEELGRVGAVDPLLDTGVLAGGLLATSSLERHSTLLASLLEGTVQLAFAHAEPDSRYDLSRVATRVTAIDDGYRIEGRKSVVVNAPAADWLVVSARTSGDVADTNGISLFIVASTAKGIESRSYSLASGGRASEIVFDAVDVPTDALLGTSGEALAAIELAQARGTLAICAEALGLMEAIRSLTADYLRTRKQFGRPIGSFQALQHRMADVLIEIEQARSAVINLAGHLDAPRNERERQVSAAKNLVGRVAQLVAEEGVQLHGGIGMTMEYSLGHLVRRLTMVDHRFGDTTHHLERFIALSVA